MNMYIYIYITSKNFSHYKCRYRFYPMYLKSPACCGPAFSQALMAPKLAAGAETLAEERNAEQQCRQCLNENYVAIGCLNPAFLR